MVWVTRRWMAVAAAALLLAGCGGQGSVPGNVPGKAPAKVQAAGQAAGQGAGQGGSAAKTGPAALKQATLVLDWYPNGDHGGIYSTRAKGYDRQAGIDVKIQVPSDPAAALKEVASGKVQFAVSYEPEVFLARAQGLPIVAIAAMVQRPLNSIITLKSSGISTPSQLAGKTIGTDGLPNTIALLDTVLRHVGVSPSRVKQVVVSEGNVPALLSRKVDAIIGAYWNWEAVEIAQKGQPVNVMRLNRYGVPNYDELVFVTSDATLKAHPRMVRDFLAAEMKGERFAMDHPKQAGAFLVKASSALKPALVDRSLQLLKPVWQDGAPRLGYMDAGQWQAFDGWMVAHRLIKHAVPVGQAMTDAYLPK